MLHNQSRTTSNTKLTLFSCICAAMLLTTGISNQSNAQQRDELEDDKEELERKVEGLENNIISLNNRTSQMLDETAILNQQLEEQNSKVEKLKEDKQKLKNTIKQKDEELEDKEEEINKAKSQKKVGTKESDESGLQQLSNSDNPSDKTMNITMYTAGFESTQKKPGQDGYGKTASGEMVQEGVTLACPPEIPFGTEISIEGYGKRVCHDRGSAITSGHLDIYVGSLSQAQQFGRQNLEVTIH